MKRQLALASIVASVFAAEGSARQAGLLTAQSPAPAGVIAGVVLDRATGAPLEDATVLLQARGSPGRQETSDARGQFRFSGLSAGEYFVSAGRIGYLGGSYGRSTPQRSNVPLLSRAITLRQNEVFSAAAIQLWRPGAISGTVRDARGDPLAGVNVRVLARVIVSGDERLADGPVAATDDRGVFRLGNLAKGDYLVAMVVARGPAAGASSRPLDTDAHGRARELLYYPEARSSAGALPVSVDFGEERSNIDFSLPAGSGYRVTGRVLGPADALYWTVVRLYPVGDESLCIGGEAATALPKDDGTFGFSHVPPGAYVIRASQTLCSLGLPNAGGLPLPARFASSNGMNTFDGLSVGFSTQSEYRLNEAGVRTRYQPQAAYFGETRVTIDELRPGDIANVSVTLERAVRIAGTITLEGGPIPAATLSADPIDGNPSLGRPTARVAQRGQFVLDGLLPERYVIRLRSNSSLAIKSVIWQGADYTERGFDASARRDFEDVVVTLAPGGTISGVVRDAAGKPSTTAVVLFFPTDQAQWRHFGIATPRMGRVIPDAEGAYRTPVLPAGDYYLAAADVDDSSAGRWQVPASLAAIAPRATKVQVTWQSAHTQNLQVLPGVRGS